MFKYREQLCLTEIQHYADNRRRALQFDEGDKAFLKISPTKGVQRFGIKGKLSPKFIVPFKILKIVGEVAYDLALPWSLARVHNVLHVSQFRKYIHDPSHVLVHESLQNDENLTYEKRPIRILDRQMKELRNKIIPQVKVLWSNQHVKETTWERKVDMRESYPQLFF